MKTILHLLPFELKMLWRSNLLKIILLVVLGTGIYGIYFGKFEIDKQTERIAKVQAKERQQFDSLMYWVTLDTAIADNKAKYSQAVSPTGVGWNKHFTYYLAKDTPPVAGLCLGQRDLYPVYYGFNVTDLARQVNVGELANPMKLLTGNFDLSYVFVFLFPLLIIVLFYNLFAAEKEGGTLSLLHAQVASINTILLSKGILRFLLVCLLATTLLFIGFLIQGVSFGENISMFFSFLLVIFAYCFFWCAMMALIVALRRSSALSAMLGLGIWLLLTLIAPALINLIISSNQPSPNRTEAIHAVRDRNDQNWDSPKSFLLDEFYADYPQYNDGDTLDFDKWYYASFTMLDKEANALNATFEAQLAKRNAMLARWQWLAPAAMVHERLSSLANTDRASHLNFVSEVHRYHQTLKDIYYPKIFNNEQFTMEDLKKLEDQL